MPPLAALSLPGRAVPDPARPLLTRPTPMPRKLADLMWQQPTIMSRYPHMLSQDAAVWTAYLRDVGPDLDAVAYDVHVGTPVALPQDATPMELQIAAGVTRKRIDAVYRAGTRIVVVEVKPFGNHGALGQALQYRDLFRSEFPEAAQASAMVVCAEADIDIRITAQKLGILIFNVPVTDY